jgi:hypothetical protein
MPWYDWLPVYPIIFAIAREFTMFGFLMPLTDNKTYLYAKSSKLSFLCTLAFNFFSSAEMLNKLNDP